MSEQETTTEIQPGILAAVCPPGWRRDPMTGRPVMPCLGKLLFPCAPSEVPTRSEITKQVWQVKFEPLIEPLVMSVLHSAELAKRKHGACMHLSDERAVSLAVDAALRSQGEVRIVKTAAGWEEVGDSVSSHFPALENAGTLETTDEVGDGS